MTTLADIEVAITGNLAPFRAAQKQALSEARNLDNQMAKAAAVGAPAFGKFEDAAVRSAGAVRLNQQQLMNMQFQMNDMAVMLASGQNPFTLIMQQGMQIGQMFGPGSTVQGALRATGQSLITFLTNPINLAIAGTAVLAGAIPMVWRAFTGPEAEKAEKVLDRIHDRIESLPDRFESARDAAKDFLAKGLSQSEIEADFQADIRKLENIYDEAVENIGASLDEIRNRTFEALSPDDLMQSEGIKTVEAQLLSLFDRLKAGQIEIGAFREQLALIESAGNISQDIRNKANEIRELGEEAYEAANGIEAMNIAMSNFGKDAFDNLRFEMEGAIKAPMTIAEKMREAENELRKQSRRQSLEAEERESERDSRRAEREGKRLAREQERAAIQQENNRIYLDDLQKEIVALNSVGESREAQLAQLREEQEIRDAIASLGKEGSQAEIELIRTLIPMRNAALEASREREQAMRQEAIAAGQMGAAIGSAMHGISQGGDQAKEAVWRLGMQMANIILQAQLLQSFGNGAGGLNPTGSFLSSILGSVLQFREGGGPVRAGQPYIVGEKRPELFVPNQNGVIVPHVPAAASTNLPMASPNLHVAIENHSGSPVKAAGGSGSVADPFRFIVGQAEKGVMKKAGIKPKVTAI